MNERVSSRASDLFLAFWDTKKETLRLPKKKENTHHIVIVEYIELNFSNYGG